MWRWSANSVPAIWRSLRMALSCPQGGQLPEARRPKCGVMATVDRQGFDRAGQFGLVTRTQLLEAGWTYSAIRHGLATTWHQPAPGVFIAHRGSLTVKQRLIAGALWAGRSAVLTAGAALRIYHGVDQVAAQGVDHASSRAIFVIPQVKGRSQACALAIRRRTERPPPVAHWSGIVPVATPARALVDHARWGGMQPRDLKALTISCLQQRVTTPELLCAALGEAADPCKARSDPASASISPARGPCRRPLCSP